MHDAGFIVFIVVVLLIFALGLGGWMSCPEIEDIPFNDRICVEVKDIGGHHNLCEHECFEWKGLKICYEPTKEMKAEKEE